MASKKGRHKAKEKDPQLITRQSGDNSDEDVYTFTPSPAKRPRLPRTSTPTSTRTGPTARQRLRVDAVVEQFMNDTSDGDVLDTTGSSDSENVSVQSSDLSSDPTFQEIELDTEAEDPSISDPETLVGETSEIDNLDDTILAPAVEPPTPTG